MYTKKSEARHENDSAALIQAQDFRINLDVAERNGMRLIGPLDPSPAALDRRRAMGVYAAGRPARRIRCVDESHGGGERSGRFERWQSSR